MVFSFHDLNRPVLTFVGRPGDWNKGLETLFDAVDLLTSVSALPAFQMWIVGGSERELRLVKAWVAQRPGVLGLLKRGALTLWGRVAPDALPEIMSRSSVVVMPSNREQFGIVAVEAMMCGCPVLATRIGGLPDIVIDGRVGHLVNARDSTAMAFALSSVLRFPHHWRRLGKRAAAWARDNFAQETVFGRLRALYAGELNRDIRYVGMSETRFSPVLRKSQQMTVGRALGAPLRSLEIIGASRSGTTFLVDGAILRGVVKVIDSYVDARDELFGNAGFRGTEFERYRMKLTFMSGSSLGPAIHAADAKRRLLILEWIDGSSGIADDAMLGRLRAWRPIPEWQSKDFANAVTRLRRKRTLQALRDVDRSAIVFNAQCAAGPLSVHPAVELERLRRNLTDRSWPLKTYLNDRLIKAVGEHIHALSDADGTPELCHGDLRRGRVLVTVAGPRFVGLRKLHYAVGPLDEVRWALYTVGDLANGRLDHELIMLTLSKCHHDLRMAIAWAAAEALTEALCASVCGDTTLLRSTPQFLDGLLTSQRSATIQPQFEGIHPAV